MKLNTSKSFKKLQPYRLNSPFSDHKYYKTNNCWTNREDKGTEAKIMLEIILRSSYFSNWFSIVKWFKPYNPGQLEIK